ncbi:MAG: hypothetical protein MJB57_14370 [Gemmatimonadetes bacterium]|nr:hypothetical protein [Gemmatimonadota bacterium]
MDMDLVVVLGFVLLVTITVTGGIVLFPISRKLGLFLEQAAKERADRLAARATGSPSSDVTEQLIQLMNNLESQVGHLTERQAFTERLLETRTSLPADESASGAREE